MKTQFLLRLQLLFACFFIFNLGIAQNQDSTQQVTLTTSLENLMQKSESFNEYKVIKKDLLIEFNKTLKDSLSTINKLKANAYVSIKDQKLKISNLEATIIEKDALINSSDDEKNSISVMGITFQKKTYSIISIIIPFLLIVIIIVIWIRSISSIKNTKEANNNLEEIQLELEEYKKRALDTQMKLKRELQTERNKLSEKKK